MSSGCWGCWAAAEAEAAVGSTGVGGARRVCLDPEVRRTSSGLPGAETRAAVESADDRRCGSDPRRSAAAIGGGGNGGWDSATKNGLELPWSVAWGGGGSGSCV